MSKIQTSDEILKEAVAVEKNKTWESLPKVEVKKKKARKENPVSKKKAKETENKETENKTRENDLPWWFLELFDHLEYMDRNKMDVHIATDDSRTVQENSPKVLERKLFLIFMATWKRERIWDEGQKPIPWYEWVSVAWRWRNIMMKDFADAAWVNRNTLTVRKWEKWFHEHRINLMKYIYSKRTPHVIRNLFDWATQKDDNWKTQTAAIKLYLEYIESFKQTIEHSWEVNFKDTKELDKADLDELKDVITSHLKQR